MSGYIGDISSICCVSGGVDTIFRGEKSGERYFRKYRQNIGDISAIYWRYIRDKSSNFWRYFPSFMQRDLTAQITPVLIRRPKCDSNGNTVIQRPDYSQFFIQRSKLICNGKLIFQWLFWPKFLL